MSDKLNWTIDIPNKNSALVDWIEDAARVDLVESSGNTDNSTSNSIETDGTSPTQSRDTDDANTETDSAQSTSPITSSNLSNAPTFKVVQITDIHFDPYFSPGTRTGTVTYYQCVLHSG